MFVLADKSWPKYMKSESRPIDSLSLIKAVIDKISLQHTTPNFQSAIEKQIPELAEFVKKKRIYFITFSHWLFAENLITWLSELLGSPYRHRPLR
jgi:hypothetical protein